MVRVRVLRAKQGPPSKAWGRTREAVHFEIQVSKKDGETWTVDRTCDEIVSLHAKLHFVLQDEGTDIPIHIHTSIESDAPHDDVKLNFAPSTAPKKFTFVESSSRSSANDNGGDDDWHLDADAAAAFDDDGLDDDGRYAPGGERSAPPLASSKQSRPRSAITIEVDDNELGLKRLKLPDLPDLHAFEFNDGVDPASPVYQQKLLALQSRLSVCLSVIGSEDERNMVVFREPLVQEFFGLTRSALSSSSGVVVSDAGDAIASCTSLKTIDRAAPLLIESSSEPGDDESCITGAEQFSGGAHVTAARRNGPAAPPSPSTPPRDRLDALAVATRAPTPAMATRAPRSGDGSAAAAATGWYVTVYADPAHVERDTASKDGTEVLPSQNQLAMLCYLAATLVGAVLAYRALAPELVPVIEASTAVGLGLGGGLVGKLLGLGGQLGGHAAKLRGHSAKLLQATGSTLAMAATAVVLR